jgi:cytochrome c
MNRTYTITFTCLMALALVLAACGGGQSGPAPSAAAEPLARTISANGDPEKGKLYYENEGGCLACHSTGVDKLVGPGLAGVMTTAGPVYPEGVNYRRNLPNGQPRTEGEYRSVDPQRRSGADRRDVAPRNERRRHGESAGIPAHPAATVGIMHT